MTSRYKYNQPASQTSQENFEKSKKKKKETKERETYTIIST